MRFVIGPPPGDPTFTPEQDGWSKLRDPSPLLLTLVGGVAGLPLAVLMFFGWSFFPADGKGLEFHISPATSRVVIALLILWPFLFFAAVIIVHELIHGLACPRFGLSQATILGVWPSRWLPYACHLGEMPSWRGVIVALAPFLVLSVAPLLVALLGGPRPFLAAVVSIGNAALCGGDAAICTVMVAQTGLAGHIRNQGWDTWWRPANAQSS